MNVKKAEMDTAIEEWLDSREGYERYVTTTQRLYAVFSDSWQGSRRNIADAFAEFREALIRNSPHAHREVTEVNTNRHPGC